LTLPRSLYRYDSQTVSSDGGAFTLSSTGALGTVSLQQGETVVWTSSSDVAPKQLAVADDGTSAVIDAGDTLTVRGRAGELLGAASVLDLACGVEWRRGRSGEARTPVRWSTAGPSWEEFLAFGFARFEGRLVVLLSGRGEAPLVLVPETLTRVPVPEDEVRRLLRDRSAAMLRAAVHALAGAPGPRDVHATPWRLAAVGWARVAGETGAREAVTHVLSLLDLELHTDGRLSLPSAPQPTDRLRVNQFALDPLRQAARLALIRLGVSPPPVAVLQLARREGWLRLDWVTFPVPADAARALTALPGGATPSELVALAGPPSHVESDDGGVVWSYDLFAPGGGRAVDVRWSKAGFSVHAGPLPAAAIDGRVA
jgi:hypothetical protein